MTDLITSARIGGKIRKRGCVDFIRTEQRPRRSDESREVFEELKPQDHAETTKATRVLLPERTPMLEQIPGRIDVDEKNITEREVRAQTEPYRPWVVSR